MLVLLIFLKTEFLAGNPLEMVLLLLFNLVFKFLFIVLFPHQIFLGKEILHFFLDNYDEFLKLIKLILNIVSCFLCVFKFLTDSFNFGLLRFNLRAQCAHFFIDFFT